MKVRNTFMFYFAYELLESLRYGKGSFRRAETVETDYGISG